jgi:hypothetical protein
MHFYLTVMIVCAVSHAHLMLRAFLLKCVHVYELAFLN